LKFFINKPLSGKTRRNLSRIKTLAIIILSIFVILEFSYRKKTEVIYNNQISEYKNMVDNIHEEMILLRNSMPIDIVKMGNITNNITNIKKLIPNMELPTAEFYASAITVEARKYDNLEAEHLIALIRQESYFVPDTVSWAGAIGLGQVMPMTGKWIIEDKWHLTYNDSMLFDPNINIKVTAWYLDYLMSKNNNNFKLALAYYNGGYYQNQRYKLLLDKKQGLSLTTEELAQLDKIPDETLDYVPSVNGYYKQIKELKIITIKK